MVAPVRCPTCRQLKKRGNPANARYWLLLHLIADKLKPEGQSHSAELWHVYMKQRYIGVNEVTMPNKQTLLMPKSSADLNTSEFAEYMMKVELLAQERDVYMDELEPT